MTSNAPPSLTLHQAGGQGWVGRLCVPFDGKVAAETASPSQTIFILDRSGSMGSKATMMANQVLPAVAMQKLGLTSKDVVTLITFDNEAETLVASIEGLMTAPIYSRGCTRMAGVFQSLLNSVDYDNPRLQIVAVSDGHIQDTEYALEQASHAASLLKGHFLVSVTAVRLFTSTYGEPDTRALASVLQLRTTTTGSATGSSIVDVDATQDWKVIVEQISVAVTPNDESGGNVVKLSSSTPCLLQVPWADPSLSLNLVQNPKKPEAPLTLWLSAPPEGTTFDGVDVKVEQGAPLTHDTLSVLLEDKLNYFLDQLRLLKVINTPTAKAELTRIVTYFSKLEESLPPPSDLAPLLQDGSLSGRAQFMKASLLRRVRSVTHAMETIANDERVAKLNLAQQADYLRQVGGGQTPSKTAKGLARRADAQGLDFEATMQAEVIAMAAHIDSLAEVDDSDHAVSFYSQATTLEGIRCLVDLAREPEVLTKLTAAEMLRLFNVVGIPAVGPIGDFPDPEIYGLDEMLFGSHVSVADITMALDQGGALMAPGYNREIITAIPVFEDKRVQRFLQRYARSSLEYICSIGMRRMIADVPKTYIYTLCSGIRKMVVKLDTVKTELQVDLFTRLVGTFENAVNGSFDDILAFVQDVQDPSLSYYLGHNGVSPLVAPILHLTRTKQTENIPRILRALYSFEAYRGMRRIVQYGPTANRQELLDEILGVDFKSSRATPLPPLFTRPAQGPAHCSVAVINDGALLEKCRKQLEFVNYTTLLQPMFAAIVHSGDDCLQAMRQIPSMTGDTITAALGLPESISREQFLLHNIVEGFLCTDKSSRIDKETEKPKLGDLGNPGVGDEMIRKYVESRYKADYKQRLKVQLAEEHRILQDELVSELLSATDIDEFVSLLVDGKRRQDISFVIDRDQSPAFSRLHDTLMDSTNVPLRVAKLCVLYTGTSPSTGQACFNGGNLYRTNLTPLKALLLDLNEQNAWEDIEEAYRSRGHVYRSGGLANRHGHSNDFPSYFAFGCQTLEEYHGVASEESWREYIADHCDCCGVASYLTKLNVSKQLGG